MCRIRLIVLTLAACAVIVAFTSCSQERTAASEFAGKDVSIFTYNMGEPVHAGRLTYTVFDHQWLTQIGSGIDARMPQNRFFLLRISVSNTASGDAAIPILNLIDDAGNTYPELSNGDGVQGWLGYLRRTHGSQPSAGYILFDVPPKHYRLKVTDENGEHPASIDIPLSFDSDAPDAALPGSPGAMLPEAQLPGTGDAAPARPKPAPVRKQ
jgi:hypothetical protein